MYFSLSGDFVRDFFCVRGSAVLGRGECVCSV